MSFGDQAATLAKKADGRTEAELLASTLRSLAEADESSNRVLTTLNEQTEQLHKIQDDTRSIDSNLDKSEYLLRSLKRFGWVRNLFRKQPKSSPDAKQAEGPSSTSAPAASSGSGSQSSSSSSGYPSGAKAAAAPSANGRGAARLLAQEDARRSAGGYGSDRRDPGIDKAYDQIDNILEGLKHKGAEINRTLNHHNEILPEVASSVQKSQDRMKKQQQDIKTKLGC
eukprot:TRINITY_DN66709_c0_g1_i1.p1 TRINITY_DN66709_c0_g1~~TRINITY_DN66709_c0_g1_i1.p1  ORF type:complete len:248 (+),score=50.89 TRINITY_DN66709_c0_g1_i1:68-745(+)